MNNSAPTPFQLCAVRFIRLAILLASVLAAAGCASTTANLQAPPPLPATQAKLILQPGDQIELKFPYWQELNDTQTIRPDGYINLQLIDAVKAQGLTPEELDEKLTKLYESKIKNPVISVVVRSLVDQRIYVGGEVNKPGLLTLQGDVNVLQAVFNAGGFNEYANPGDVIVIRKAKDGKPVPYIVDLSKSLSGQNPGGDFSLQPDDVVYVPKTTIANLDKFVNQYIAELFMFKGIGFGFTYVLHDSSYQIR